MRSIVSDFLVAFGINSSGANQIKKERNLTSEVNSNNQQIMINREYWLSTRKQACEICNEIFGTNLSVDVIKEEKDNEYREYGNEQDGNIPEYQVRTDLDE